MIFALVLNWGDTGTLKANGKTKGAMGISHIIEARMRKDGISYDEVVSMLTDKIVPAIAQGRVFDIQVSHNGNETSKLTYDGHFVALRKAKGSNAWIITAYELFEDGRGKEEGKTTPTEHQSYSSRTDAGASNKSSVPSSDANINQKICHRGMK